MGVASPSIGDYQEGVILEILGSIILEVAIGKSADLLLSGLRSVELEEVHKKLDALLLGEFRAACRILTDAEKLGAGNDAMLLDALRLFELSAGRFDILVEKHRQQLFPNFWGRMKRFNYPKGALLYGGATKEEEESTSAELLALEDISAHLVYEYVRFLCYVGALRVSLLVDGALLAPLKQERVKEIAAEIRSFVEDARSKLSTSYENRGKIEVLEKLERRFLARSRSQRVWYPSSLPVMLRRKVVGWAKGETYDQYSERLHQEYIRTLQAFCEWEKLDLRAGCI